MQVLAEYYEKPVVDEHNAFSALNDELAALELTVEESEDLDAFDEKSKQSKTPLGSNWKAIERLRSKNCCILNQKLAHLRVKKGPIKQHRRRLRGITIVANTQSGSSRGEELRSHNGVTLKGG